MIIGCWRQGGLGLGLGQGQKCTAGKETEDLFLADIVDQVFSSCRRVTLSLSFSYVKCVHPVVMSEQKNEVGGVQVIF